MPTVIDATVVNQAYDTSGNGGRKLVRLENGWLVAAVIDSTNNTLKLIKSFDGFATKTEIVSVYSTLDAYIVPIGNNIGVMRLNSTKQSVNFLVYNEDGSQLFVHTIDNGQSDLNKGSIAINSEGTELHAAWASKNSTYPNSFNIRYAKGTINTDGSVSWGAVEKVTSANLSGLDFKNPSVVVANNVPAIFAERAYSGSNMIFIYSPNITTADGASYTESSSSLKGKTVYNGGSYAQSSPSAIFVPQSVNGLPNGRIKVTWNAKDSTHVTNNTVMYSYSDDGGITWSTAQELTDNSDISNNYPSVTSNESDETFIVFTTNAPEYGVRVLKLSGTTWTNNLITSGTIWKNYPSTLFDNSFSLNFTEPLFIYQDQQGDKVGFYGTWTVTTISVPQGHIGQKTSADKSNILTYSITTDGEMSDIIEKINDVTIATRTNPTSGQEFTVSLSQEQWDAIQYGNGHTLTIEMNGETWTYTFDKRLNANDDILSAVKGVQDLQDHLNAVKAQLGSAIRANGGTVNDTDAWSVFVSAVSNMMNKRWASGTTTSSSSTLSFSHADGTGVNLSYVEVTGLNFTPSCILIYSVTNTNNITILYPENIWSSYSYPIRIIATQYATYGSGTVNSRAMKLEGNAYVTQGEFRLPYLDLSKTIKWIAFE